MALLIYLSAINMIVVRKVGHYKVCLTGKEESSRNKPTLRKMK